MYSNQFIEAVLATKFQEDEIFKLRVKISQQYNNIQEFEKKFDIKQEDDDNANFFSYKLKVYNERQLVLRIYEYVQNQAVLEGMGAYDLPPEIQAVVGFDAVANYSPHPVATNEVPTTILATSNSMSDQIN